MSIEYDDITAFHYASYRPLLHQFILKKYLGSESFDSGLDIGCGTGHSAIALADFCNTIVGIDPSTDMISKGIVHPKVHYKFFDKNHIDFKDYTFDIITLAGSLWYAKSQKLLDEIERVSKQNATILVYDFELLLKDILIEMGFAAKDDTPARYNHQEDFSDLNLGKIELLKKDNQKVLIQINPSYLAHLLLSVKEQYTFLASIYGSYELYDKIVSRLNKMITTAHFDIQANTFSSLYRIN